jgi:hypothetical protein
MISKKARARKWSVRWVAFLMLCVGLYLNPTSSDAKDILIGLSQDITGIMAAEGRTHTDASLMAIEEWNAKGGIKGQKMIVFMNHGVISWATGNAKILKDKGVVLSMEVLIQRLPYRNESAHRRFRDQRYTSSHLSGESPRANPTIFLE